MDHTATRLAFECQVSFFFPSSLILFLDFNFFHQDFNEEIEKHRKSSEEQKAAAKKKIDELNSDLDQAR